MTEKEIIKNNELIAEFMGWIKTEKDLVFNSLINGVSSNSVFKGWIRKEVKYIKGVPIFVVKENKSTGIEYLRKLHYHDDIMWLMDVHAKIVSIAYENKWIGFNLAVNSSVVRHNMKNKVIYVCTITGIPNGYYISINSEKSIESAMYACFIAFIQWYNEINNK
jgi:hypothetical protein